MFNVHWTSNIALENLSKGIKQTYEIFIQNDIYSGIITVRNGK